MKWISHSTLSLALFCVPHLASAAKATYQLTVINGSQTSLSPGVIYASKAGKPLSGVGVLSTEGFVDICEKGNPARRLVELAAHPEVTAFSKTNGMIQPGSKATFEIEVSDINQQVIHFETMYGQSKDACAKISVGPAELNALAEHITPAIAGRDDAILTGAFSSPVITSPRSACATASTAIDCLRTLSSRNPQAPVGAFFSPYSVSVQQFLEKKYGQAAIRPLIFAPAGAVAYRIVLKH